MVVIVSFNTLIDQMLLYGLASSLPLANLDLSQKIIFQNPQVTLTTPKSCTYMVLKNYTNVQIFEF